MQVTVKSIPMYYEEYGAGIPLLMLHGWPTDHRHMVADMEPLFEQRRGWRRLYPDLPGMGNTPGAEWIASQDDMLEVAMAFLEQVAPDQRFVVAGTSYGGYLARGFVHKLAARMDGLLLLVPSVETDPGKRQLPPQQILIRDPNFLAALRPEEAEFADFFVIQSVEGLESFRKLIRPAVAASDQAFLERVDQHYAFSFPVDQLAEPFPAPALILTGRQDFICGYREAWAILENYSRGTFAVLDRAGHGLGREQQRLFHILAGEWLDRVEEYMVQSRL